MAANPKQGRYGNLHAPKKREAQLRKFAHLPLADAGKHMGIRAERARQLYRLYGIPRKKHKVRRIQLASLDINDLRTIRDRAVRNGEPGLALKCAIAIDRKRKLY